MKISSPLAVLLTFAVVVLVLALFAGTAAPAQAQSNNGLPWDSVKATLVVWATQMPLNQVATQAAMQGLQMPRPLYATAYAMLTQMPAADVFGTLIAPNFMPPQPTAGPIQPTAVPAQPTAVPPGGGQPGQPTAIPPQPATNIPMTATPVMPTLTPIPPTPTIGMGQFSGQVLYPPQTGKESAGIQITLTRPDGSSITLPTGGNGVFAFSNMTAGPYTLVAQAQGYLTTQTSFVLNAGEERQLPTAVLVVGDTNGDNRVDLSDAALVASNFNGPAIVTEVDLNEDGWIDVRDLTLIGAAFGLSGPTPWQDS